MVSNLLEASMAAAVKATPVTSKHSLSVKLNNENHLLRKQQVFAAIRGHKLMNFLESCLRPQQSLSSQDEENGNVNVEFSALFHGSYLP